MTDLAHLQTTIATMVTALSTTKASHASRDHAVGAARSGLQARRRSQSGGTAVSWRRRTSMTWTAKVSSLLSSPAELLVTRVRPGEIGRG